MKIIAPDYYPLFHCIAGACRHSCCRGWEIDIDEDRLGAYRSDPLIAPHISEDGAPHFRLEEDERCPFLRADGLCELIITRGEDVLCQICRDHPRFRNYWSDREELGLGLVCEEAARILLTRETPMKLTILSDDGGDEAPDEDETWLLEQREAMLAEIDETGPRARLMEYLIYRHLPDALYDGRVEARTAFIKKAFETITAAWDETDGSIESLVECARQWSYDIEYDDEALEAAIAAEDE